MYHDGQISRLLHRAVHVLNVGLTCFFLLTFSCSQGQLLAPPQDSILTIAELTAKLKTNPDDPETLRQLGILYFYNGDYSSAQILLERTLSFDQHNSETLLFLGLTHENSGNLDSALSIYAGFPDAHGKSEAIDLLEGRYHWLVNKQIEQDILQQLEVEETLSLNSVSPDLIAVFPLTYDGSDQTLSPLGRGLAEMLAIDFGYIEQLRIVERVRLNELMAELKYSNSQAVSEGSAPRIGKLLKAGTLIHGRYRDLADHNLRIDLAAWNITESQAPSPNSATDQLENLFKVQKALVFQTLDELGIEPTPEERRKIEYIPTRNIQAFLRYSLALQLQDEKRYQEAEQEFEAAARLDPNFTAARKKMRVTRNLRKAALPVSSFVNKYPRLANDPKMRKVAQNRLMRRRIGNMRNNLGSGFRPGRERRKGAIDLDRSTGGSLSPTSR